MPALWTSLQQSWGWLFLARDLESLSGLLIGGNELVEV
jgi:hypothetical protein